MIRNYADNDKAKVIEFHKRIMIEAGAYLPGPWDDDFLDIEAVYVRPGGCFVLIEDGGVIQAMGALKILSNKDAEVKRMRVETSLQRRGLGQKIMNHLIQHAKSKGIERVILDTTENQIAARHFYEKNGFVEYRRGKWNDITMIFYEKYISASSPCTRRMPPGQPVSDCRRIAWVYALTRHL